MATAGVKSRPGDRVQKRIESRNADRNSKAAEHLDSLRTLATELERAMQAIASNDIDDLEASIAKQQALTSRLADLADDLCIPLETKLPASTAHADEEMMRQIHGASETLQKLNLRYAALLRHSSRSLALMASLFSSFQGQFQEASGTGSRHKTWSCRM